MGATYICIHICVYKFVTYDIPPKPIRLDCNPCEPSGISFVSDIISGVFVVFCCFLTNIIADNNYYLQKRGRRKVAPISLAPALLG